MSSVPPERLRRLDGLDRAIILAVAVVSTASAVVLLSPGIEPHVVAPGLDVLLDTVTTLVTVGITVLAWLRYRDRGLPIDLLQTSAFLVLAVANVAGLIVATVQLEPAVGTYDPAGEAAAYVFSAARLLSAFLLVAGGYIALTGRTIRHPAVALVGPLAVLIAFVILVGLAGSILPPFAEWRLVGSGPAATFVPVSTQLGALAQLPGAALFLWAAALTRRLCRRGAMIGERYLAVGLVFAAFTQLHLALYPPMYPGLVTTDDFLRVAFSVTLLLGIEAEARMAMGALRRANGALERLREAEAERAALEERARVSRELHDGVAQDLWLARLKLGRLAQLSELGPEGRQLCHELEAAIDAGLTEARQAVLALRYRADPDAGLAELLRRYVDDFADRFGLRAEIEVESDLPPLPSRAEAEVIRIAQEALANVRRHADATVVRVRLAGAPDRMTVIIDDNGRGFDPAAIREESFGLASMRERAGLIGGRLVVESRPRDGTRVRLDVPVAGSSIGAPVSAGTGGAGRALAPSDG